jgi:hypothetical protein
MITVIHTMSKFVVYEPSLYDNHLVLIMASNGKYKKLTHRETSKYVDVQEIIDGNREEVHDYCKLSTNKIQNQLICNYIRDNLGDLKKNNNSTYTVIRDAIYELESK